MIEIEAGQTNRSEFKDEDLVCYCFRYTKRDIEKDFSENGRSLIYRRVVRERKAGTCSCAALNPKGT